MPLELTPQQSDSIARAGAGPLRVIDAATGAGYVLLPAGEYDRLRGSKEAGADVGVETKAFDVRASYPAQNAVAAAAGWADPIMDEYDDYDARMAERDSAERDSAERDSAERDRAVRA